MNDIIYIISEISPLTLVMLVFSILGGIDRICGNKAGLGKEFEKGFMLLGTMALSMLGMIVLAVVQFITGINKEAYSEAALVCANASAVMSGAFPLIFVVSKILARPLRAFGKLCGMNEASAMGLISTLATNATTFENMKDMDKKGTLVNSAFAISAAFTFAGHLAYTMAFPGGNEYVPYVIAGKLIAGVLALCFALFLSEKLIKE